MSDADRRVRETARDARSGDDMVREEFDIMWDENDMAVPVDRETIDERASTQMGGWQSVRRDAG